MARYRRHLYGTSLYGIDSASSGKFISDEFDTGKVLNGTVSINMEAMVIAREYLWDDHFMEYESGWNNGVTIVFGSKATFNLPGRNFTLCYTPGATNDTAKITVKRVYRGVTVLETEHLLDMTTGTSYPVPDTDALGEYEITIEKTTNNSSPINVARWDVFVNDLLVETRAGYYDPETMVLTWGNWDTISYTYDEEQTDATVIESVPYSKYHWDLSGVTPDYSNKNRIQCRLTLITTEDRITPEVRRFEMLCGNTENYAPSGKYEIVINAGSNFKEWTDINWVGVEDRPNTKLWIQTQTSNNNQDDHYTMLSAPYVNHDESQIRLRAGETFGSIVSEELTPENVIKWLQYRTIDWSGKVNNYIYNPETDNMYVRYTLLKRDGESWVNVYEDKDITFAYPYSLETYSQLTKFNIDITQPTLKIKATLYRLTSSWPTPYASRIDFKCSCFYDETKHVPGWSSVVDSNNTGIKLLMSFYQLGFETPIGLQEQIALGNCDLPVYTLINTVGYPFIQVYWKSEEDKPIRSISTNDIGNSIWVKNVETSENLRYYQWCATPVVFPLVSKNPIQSFFIHPQNGATPSASKIYRYFLESGWDNPPNGIDPGSDINEDEHKINLFWQSRGGGDDNETPPAGDPSGWDMNTSDHSDLVFASMSSELTGVEVDWESEYINIRNAYISGERPHYNNALELPLVHPAAHTDDGDHLYFAEVVPGTVRCNNLTVPDNRIVVDSFNVTFDEQARETLRTMVKGVSGGKDLLPHWGVLEITGVFDSPDAILPSYIEGVDYVLDPIVNAIDWSPDGVSNMQPPSNSTYYINYRYRKPVLGEVTFKCNYSEPITKRDVWISNEVMTRSARIKHGEILKDTNLLPITEGNIVTQFPSALNQAGELKFDIDSFEYTVDNNNLWVKSYVTNEGIVSSLRWYKPKDNWIPKIHGGYYYLSNKRSYMYSDKIYYTLDDEFVPLASNISYVSGKFGQGIRMDGIDSSLTYPITNIDLTKGAISLWFKPSPDGDYVFLDNYMVILNEYTSTLFEIYSDSNNIITLHYVNGLLEFGLLSNPAISYEANLSTDTYSHLVINWNNSVGLFELYVNGLLVATANELMPELPNAKSFNIGSCKNSVNHICCGTIDEFAVYKDPLTKDGVSALYGSTEATVFDSGSMLMKCGFENNINESFDGSYVGLSHIPTQRAPLIVQKFDGTVLRKVAFSDPITGDLVTYNTEVITSDGTNRIKVSYRNLETDLFQTLVYNSSGVIIGTPLTIEDDIITMSLSSEELEEIVGTDLTVVYQPKDCYVLDLNGENGGAFIRIGQNIGEPLVITYETAIENYSLANTAELNPILNPNHSGFLFLTDDVGELSSYRINANPSHLMCNGIDTSVIIVDTLDKYGNPTNNVELELSCGYGTITKYTPYGSDSTVYIRDEAPYNPYTLDSIAGRHVYIYRAPHLRHGQLDEAEYDIIRISDVISGLGTETKVKLQAIDDYGLGG